MEMSTEVVNLLVGAGIFGLVSLQVGAMVWDRLNLRARRRRRDAIEMALLRRAKEKEEHDGEERRGPRR